MRLILAVFAAMPPADGWICYRLTTTKMMVRHPELGSRICWVDGGGKVGWRPTT